jgi:hypothetical protein
MLLLGLLHVDATFASAISATVAAANATAAFAVSTLSIGELATIVADVIGAVSYVDACIAPSYYLCTSFRRIQLILRCITCCLVVLLLMIVL